MIFITNLLTQLHRLQWWQWCQVVGLTLPAIFLTCNVKHPLLWALAIHFFIDFTAQTDQTCAGKLKGDWRVLAYHAFISGGYPGLIVGGLPGLAISATAHLLLDKTNKFGLNLPFGPLLDQAAHIITLIITWWLLEPFFTGPLN